MNLAYKKSTRILTDVMDHCQMLGCTHFTVDFLVTDKNALITVSGKVPSLSIEELEQMRKELRIPRQHDMEEYYWNISGGEDGDGGLSIVGMMVDEATVTYQDHLLTVSLERLN